MTKVFGFACLLLAFLLLRDAPAHAHASLVSSTPADAAVVGSVPRSVVLQFDEPVAVTSVRITTSDATQHVLTSEARNQQVIVSVPQDLPAGSHVISYRVISADGHPVFGSIVFSIGKPTRTPDAGSSSASWIIGGAIWLARWALYVGLLGSTGGAFFVTWISIHHTPARVVSGIRAAAIVGVVAMALSLGLLGLDMLGDGFGAMLVSRTWIEAARTSSGLAVLVGAAACVIAFASLAPKTNSYSRVMSAIALAGAGLALSLTGHASTAEPQWLMRPALFIHAAAAAYWVGSLVPLAAVIRAAPAQSIPTVRRFSGGAIIAVTALVVAGVAVSVVQIGSWSALIETPYGRLWVIKIFGVSLMLGLAAVNRSVLTPALSTGADVARRLVPSIAVEAAVALSVLGIVAGWRFTPPPRASVPPPAPAVHVHLHGLSAIAEVDIRPGRVGQVDVAATLLSNANRGTRCCARPTTRLIACTLGEKTYFLTTARPGHLLNLRAPPRPGRKLVPQIVSPHLAGFLIAACCSVSVGDVRARAAVLGPEQVEASVQRCLSSFLRRNPRIAIAESRVVEVRLLRRGESGPGTALKMANAYRYALPSEIADLSAVNIDMIWKPRRTHALHRSTKFGCLMSEGGRVKSTYSLAAPR